MLSNMRWKKLLVFSIAVALTVAIVHWAAMRNFTATGLSGRGECLRSLGDLAMWVEQDNHSAVCLDGVRLYKHLPGGGFPLCRLSDPPAWLQRRLRKSSVRTWLRIASPAAGSPAPRRVPIWGHTGGDFITEKLVADHAWEESLVAPLLDRLLRLGVGNATLIDIGCNIGTYTLQAAALGFPVIAVDANARNLMRVRMALREATSANPSASPSASSSATPYGSVSLLWSFISSDRSRLARLNYPADCNIGGATKFARSVPDPVEVMPLAADQLVQLVPTRMVLLKLDAEGGEADFLRTAGRLFKDRKVAAVQMEWLSRHLTGTDSADVLAFFNSHGYTAHSVDGKTQLNQGWTLTWPDNVLWVQRDFRWLL